MIALVVRRDVFTVEEIRITTYMNVMYVGSRCTKMKFIVKTTNIFVRSVGRNYMENWGNNNGRREATNN